MPDLRTWHFYMVRSPRHDLLRDGVLHDVKRRLAEHNAGRARTSDSRISSTPDLQSVPLSPRLGRR
jgi:predicted GIY-YIG superfamily endonuclease